MEWFDRHKSLCGGNVVELHCTIDFFLFRKQKVNLGSIEFLTEIWLLLLCYEFNEICRFLPQPYLNIKIWVLQYLIFKDENSNRICHKFSNSNRKMFIISCSIRSINHIFFRKKIKKTFIVHCLSLRSQPHGNIS